MLKQLTIHSIVKTKLLQPVQVTIDTTYLPESEHNASPTLLMLLMFNEAVRTFHSLLWCDSTGIEPSPRT